MVKAPIGSLAIELFRFLSVFGSYVLPCPCSVIFPFIRIGFLFIGTAFLSFILILVETIFLKFQTILSEFTVDDRAMICFCSSDLPPHVPLSTLDAYLFSANNIKESGVM